MADLKSKKLIYLKGFLFLFGGIMASLIVLLEHPSVKLAAMLALAIWCFCRAYYFVFYVIEHYVDGNYKFAGLWSFVQYFFTTKKRTKSQDMSPRPPSRGPGR
ncbi:MAG: hypothetical protein ACYSTR_08480 [Planctomycetota bacterium]|jgi:hypothetical protein